MKFTVSFEYDEAAKKWDVVVRGAASSTEAIQGFNAVVVTASQATVTLRHVATLQQDGSYKLMVGV